MSIDRQGDALVLNECGGCVAGELKIESSIMGACVLPSQAFVVSGQLCYLPGGRWSKGA